MHAKPFKDNGDRMTNLNGRTKKVTFWQERKTSSHWLADHLTMILIVISNLRHREEPGISFIGVLITVIAISYQFSIKGIFKMLTKSASLILKLSLFQILTFSRIKKFCLLFVKYPAICFELIAPCVCSIWECQKYRKIYVVHNVLFYTAGWDRHVSRVYNT